MKKILFLLVATVMFGAITSCASTKVEEKINASLTKLGLTGDQISFTFHADNTYSATIKGRLVQGTYALDVENNKITLTYLNGLGTITPQISKTGNTLSLLYDADKLLLIDDSIVRGTQLRETTEFLYQSGAKEVHIRPACPPLLYGCKYLNFSRSTSEMDLITRRVIARLENGNVTDEILEEYANPEPEKYEQMVEEIRKELKFDSLRYHRLDDMIEAIGISPCKLCTYCWNGKE